MANGETQVLTMKLLQTGLKLVARLLLSLYATLFVVPLVAAQIRVNCGGPAYTDSKGNVWAADPLTGGTTYKTTSSISGTPDQTLFQTERYGAPVRYVFSLLNGMYHVNFLFDEIYFPRGGFRVISVKVQGVTVIPSLDIAAMAGANAALIKGLDTTVTDGSLTIEIDGITQNAKINAIEILPSGPPPPPPDTTPPTVNLNQPGGGTTLSGVVPLSATAIDNVGVASVQFIVDAAAFGPPLTLTPYMLPLDTSLLTVGPHTLSATAKDAAGNVGTAPSITVIVAGQLFDFTLIYDDGTPYAPGGQLTLSETAAAGTQTDVTVLVSPAGEIKFRWPADFTKTYAITLTDAAGKTLQSQSGMLSPLLPPSFGGISATEKFSKATGLLLGVTSFAVN